MMVQNKNFFGEIDNVVLQDYSEDYTRLFNEEVERIGGILKGEIKEIHHIGSTAIPGIIGKPVIDMAIVLKGFPLGAELIKEVIETGYVFWEDNPNKNKMFFFKGLPRTHHLHIFPENSNDLEYRIYFRDKLREDPKLRQEYTRLKIMLAEKYFDDREKYTECKAESVKKVLSL